MKEKLKLILEKLKKVFTNKIVIIVLLFIILLIVYIKLESGTNEYNELKKDKDKDFVYTTKKNNNKYYHETPYINIKDENIKLINKEIDLFYSGFDDDTAEKSYEFDITDNYLSLILKVYNHDDDDKVVPSFRSFIIDLETLELLTNEKIFKLFDTNSAEIDAYMEKCLRYYYNDITEKGYYDDSQCDYTCFLNNRDITSYIDNNEYFIRKGKLIIFKPCIFESKYKEEKYFNDKKFYEFEYDKDMKKNK